MALTGIILANAFLLGLIASFQPCLFPILPTFVSYLTKGEKKINGLIASLLVTTGIMIVFTSLAFLSQGIIIYFARNYLLFRTLQGILLIVLSIILILGASIRIPLLDRLGSVANDVIDKIENPYLVSLLIGLLFTLFAAPCAIILFATAFVMTAGQSVLNIILIMGLFSLGAGAPFFIVGGVVPTMKNKIIANSQKIQRSISIIAGVIILLVGIYLTLDGQKSLPTFLK